MNQRLVGLLLLFFACLSLLVLLLVLTGIQNARNPFWNNGPVSVNLLLQTDHSLDRFSLSLYDLQSARSQKPIDQSAASAQLNNVRLQFDILWSTLADFMGRFPAENPIESFVQVVNHELNTFLIVNEPLMASTHELTDQEIERLIQHSEQTSLAVFELGRQYFVETTLQTDAAEANIDTLVGYMRLFIALLVFTGGLGTGLLVYSNRRTQKLFIDAKNARTELAATVDELRSGKREQKAKDNFLAAASHDLRQPLHALGLFLNNLERDVKPDGKVALSGAIHCTNDLNRLFNSMLDLSRLDAGMVVVENEDFNLKEILNTLHAELSPKAENYGLAMNINFDGDAYFAHSDPVLICRIVRNLIENAIMHSEGSLIDINYNCVAAGCAITISDNGCGIPEAEHEAIFSEYYQLKNPERDRSKGMGLGLSIVKRLTDLMGLQLYISSSEDTGTAFKMVLPRSEVQPISKMNTVQPAQSDNDYSHLHGAVVVVVDDDSSIRSAMRLILSKHRMVSVCVETTDEALEALAENQLEPDLIIADYRLRDHVTGDNVIFEMREAIEATVPGLIITGDTSPARMSSLINSGLDTMHKPVDAETLYQKISQILTAEFSVV